jgi:hypothetical protein
VSNYWIPPRRQQTGVATSAIITAAIATGDENVMYGGVFADGACGGRTSANTAIVFTATCPIGGSYADHNSSSVFRL